MSNKLKIYACSGIGAATDDKVLSYYTDGTNTVANTQAVNGLLAKLNAAYIRATRLANISKEEKISLLCDVDLLSVCLDAAKQFQDNTEQLHHAGEVIGVMCANGEFEYDELDARKREDHLEELIAVANEGYRDMTPIANPNAEFIAWWQKNVEERNKVGLNFGQQQNARRALKKAAESIKGIKGVGKIDPNWQNNPDLSNYLLNGGKYFLYTYFTDAQLAKLPAVFKRKKAGQMKTYNYCKSCFVDIYGSEKEMQEIIRASIVSEFGIEPEQVCADIAKNGGNSGVGMTLEMILTLVAIGLAILAAVITAICDMVARTNEAKYGALNHQIIEDSCPDTTDYSELEGVSYRGSISSNNKNLLLVAGVVVAALLFRR